MKNAIVYGLTVAAGAVMIWFVTSVLPMWVAAKQAASPAGAAYYKKHLEALATASPAPEKLNVSIPPPVRVLPPVPKLDMTLSNQVAQAIENEDKKIAAAKKAQEERDAADQKRTEEIIRGYHIKAAQMAKEREADEERVRREHELEIRRLELETARIRARAAEGSPSVVIVAPPQPALPRQTSLREIEAMEQRNEELRLLRLQVALELARLRGENVTIVDYGIGAEQRRRAASIARALNDPDPLRREKALRTLGYAE